MFRRIQTKLAYSIKICKNKQPNNMTEAFGYQGNLYHISPKRWGILMLCCSILYLDTFCYCFFSFINDMTSCYFGNVPAVTDLLTTSHLVGRLFGGIIVCFFSHWMTLKSIAVNGSAANTVATATVAVGINVRIFPVAVMGMFLNGVSSGVLMTLVQIVTVAWFPFHERGKAGAAPWAMRRLSVITSNVVATRALGNPFIVENVNHRTVISSASEGIPGLMLRYKLVFTIVFGAVSLFSLACCVLSRAFITERPPIFEQDSSSLTGSPDKESRDSYDIKKELQDLKFVVTNHAFLVILSVICMASLDTPLGTILVPSLILKEFPHIDDQQVGIVLCVGILIGSLGSITTGQILDKFSKPLTTYIFLASFSVVMLCFFALSFFIHNIVGVYTSFLILWSARDAIFVCTSHRLTDLLIIQSHAVRTKAFCIVVTVASFGIAGGTSLIRLMTEQFGSAVGILCPLPFLILTIFMYAYYWPLIGGRNEDHYTDIP